MNALSVKLVAVLIPAVPGAVLCGKNLIFLR